MLGRPAQPWGTACLTGRSARDPRLSPATGEFVLPSAWTPRGRRVKGWRNEERESMPRAQVEGG